MTLAFSTQDPGVPQTNRWIASLSDGSTVFENYKPNSISAWRRLKKYTIENSLKVTNLRLEAYGRRIIIIPYKDVNKNPQLNGYWQVSRIAKIAGAGFNIEVNWRGIGYVKKETIFITWVAEDGMVEMEERPLYMEDKDGVVHMDRGVIINDPIR